MDPNKNAPPLNPLPPVVWVLTLPMIVIELVLSAASSGFLGGRQAIGWRNWAVETFGFFNAIFDRMITVLWFPPEHLMRFVTYPFIHWSMSQALFAVVLTLALGKFVGEVYRAWAVLVVFFGSGIIGAAVYGLFLNDPIPLIGAYPAVYGLIGAFTFILWTRLGENGENRSRAFLLIGALLVFQAVFAVFNWVFYSSTRVDWVADLVGFAAGFLLSFVVSPGGWGRVLAKLRQP